MDTYDAVNFIQANTGKYPGALLSDCNSFLNSAHFTDEQKNELRELVKIIDNHLGDISSMIALAQSISVVKD